ncbi:MAG TPA: DNA primase [Candidatus Hydrogenedentes bacterium]|nr:DNA primase [Candidatus Hydrogenedentota bacterium]HQH52730.1 DNA primase [Candidatus Hydrogenedentota bacterium]
MATYSKEIIGEVLRATDIVEVVSRTLELKPSSGGRYLALCPFHHEKTPSFTVSRDRQMYHCFGCGKGGDAISFLREFDGLTFNEALQRLAEDAGIRLPVPSSRESGEDKHRARLLEVNAFAAQFFSDALRDPLRGGKGRAYLKTRELRPETVARFGLGYAADTWSGFTDAARLKGFDERLLEASGLVRRSDKGSCYDFFRDRLMVPIRDTAGRVVAFGGRDLGGESAAKYINTPENDLYKKSRVLYGLYEARDAMRREKRAILVEGYFDLLRPFDVGIENVVATCGTALTADQARLLRRYVPEVVIVYDGDAAGIQAAVRGVSILTAADLSVRALALPRGQDPDDFIRAEGAEAFSQRIACAPDFVTFYVDMSQERLETIEGRTAVARELFAILTHLDDELRREEYLKRMAQALNINEWTVRNEYQKTVRQSGYRSVKQAQPAADDIRKIPMDDCDFLAAIMNAAPLRTKVEDAIAALPLSKTPFVEALAVVLRGPRPETIYEFEDETARQLYTAATSQAPPEPERAEILVEKRLARLKRDALTEESAKLQEAIFKAERQKDTDRVMEFLEQKMSIDKRIQELGAS